MSCFLTGEYCQLTMADGKHLLQCDWGNKRRPTTWQTDLHVSTKVLQCHAVSSHCVDPARSLIHWLNFQSKSSSKNKAGGSQEGDYSRPKYPARYHSRHRLTAEVCLSLVTRAMNLVCPKYNANVTCRKRANWCTRTRTGQTRQSVTHSCRLTLSLPPTPPTICLLVTKASSKFLSVPVTV